MILIAWGIAKLQPCLELTPDNLMRLLLDTQILLWAAADTLPPRAASYIHDPDCQLFFSPASIWEVVIKNALGRSDFQVNPSALYEGLCAAGYQELPIISKQALLVQSLPMHHKDPFDRILLAQATLEELPLLTADKMLAGYPGQVIWVD